MSTLYDAWLAANDAEREAERTRVTFDEWRARRTWKESDTGSPDWQLFVGSTTLDSYEFRQPPIGFTEVEAWGDQPYRVVWASKEHRAFITYCEGDLDLVVCPTDEAFQRRWSATNKFYVRTR